MGHEQSSNYTTEGSVTRPDLAGLAARESAPLASVCPRCPAEPRPPEPAGIVAEALTLDEYQRISTRTAPMLSEPLHTPELKEALSLAGLGVAGEAGEVADLCKKVVHHDKPLTREVEAKLLAEAGDVLWYLAFLASALGVRLSYVARMNVEKLRKRYPDGWDTERANAPREG